MAGYSGKPLAAKLGIKPGCRLYPRGAPANYLELIGPLPPAVEVLARPAGALDLVHLFATDAASLARDLATYRHRIVEHGMIWVSWPKKAAKVPTDVTEDVIRERALPLGLVDIKVCAVDETWSGLKLVIRREERKG
jgi:hypothetical protein